MTYEVPAAVPPTLRYENNFYRQDSFYSSIRSVSICSTCSSEYTDSEDEDAAVRWPWIQEIKDNGDLLYIQSYHEKTLLNKNIKQADNTVFSLINKEKGIQGKLKSVIKKSRSFSKKDVINKNIALPVKNKHSHHYKKHEKTTLHPNDCDQNKPRYIENTIHVPHNMNLTCKNIAVSLHEKVEDNFISLENVLGIISGLDLDPVLDDFDSNILINGYIGSKCNANAVVVQGILPNGPAGNNEIFIGDIVTAINGNEVNLNNIEAMLVNINGDSEVILTIESLVPMLDEEGSKSQLCSIVSNSIDDCEEIIFEAYNQICAVMYLTFDGNEEKMDSDILFCYPECDTNKTLRKMRGIFLTLSDIVTSVTGTEAQSSVLVIDEKLLNICYAKIVGNNVFVVAVPAERCSSIKLLNATNELLKMFFIMYDNLVSVFNDDYLSCTKHIIKMFMDGLLQDTAIQMNTSINGIRHLQLPYEQYIEISNVLCDAAAADYGDCADDFFPHRRLYSTLGTCLFYKDQLICNHLCDEDFKDIVSFCKHHWLFLLMKTERLRQIVIWKEIFLTARRNSNLDNENSDFHTPKGAQWFVLVVGQGNSLLCTLLEAGGAASVPEGNPGPHPYYVDTSWSILAYLIENMNFEHLCQIRLDGVSSPVIVKLSDIINPKTSQSPRAIELTKRKIACHLEIEQQQLQHNNYSSSLHQSSFSESIDGRSNSRSSSVSSKSYHVLNGLHSKSFSTTSNTEVSFTTALSTKLTAGNCNTLFYYTTFQKNSGILVCPNPLTFMDGITTDMLASFQTSCEKLHKLFAYKPGTARQLENGILFYVQPTKGAEMKKGSPSVRYWVVGRLVKRGIREEEIYVCFKDGVSQNVVEMAFKMRFGCHY